MDEGFPTTFKGGDLYSSLSWRTLSLRYEGYHFQTFNVHTDYLCPLGHFSSIPLHLPEMSPLRSLDIAYSKTPRLSNALPVSSFHQQTHLLPYRDELRRFLSLPSFSSCNNLYSVLAIEVLDAFVPGYFRILTMGFSNVG